MRIRETSDSLLILRRRITVNHDGNGRISRFAKASSSTSGNVLASLGERPRENSRRGFRAASNARPMYARHSHTPRNSWPCPPWLPAHEAPGSAWKREPPDGLTELRKIIAGVSARARVHAALTRESSRLVVSHGHGSGFLASLCCTYHQLTIYNLQSIARAHLWVPILFRSSSIFARAQSGLDVLKYVITIWYLAKRLNYISKFSILKLAIYPSIYVH